MQDFVRVAIGFEFTGREFFCIVAFDNLDTVSVRFCEFLDNESEAQVRLTFESDRVGDQVASGVAHCDNSMECSIERWRRDRTNNVNSHLPEHRVLLEWGMGGFFLVGRTIMLRPRFVSLFGFSQGTDLAEGHVTKMGTGNAQVKIRVNLSQCSNIAMIESAMKAHCRVGRSYRCLTCRHGRRGLCVGTRPCNHVQVLAVTVDADHHVEITRLFSDATYFRCEMDFKSKFLKHTHRQKVVAEVVNNKSWHVTMQLTTVSAHEIRHAFAFRILFGSENGHDMRS